jgi:hypothetical protein
MRHTLAFAKERRLAPFTLPSAAFCKVLVGSCMTPQRATPPGCRPQGLERLQHVLMYKAKNWARIFPTNVGTHRRYILSHSLFEWATWSTKFACGFAHPVASLTLAFEKLCDTTVRLQLSSRAIYSVALSMSTQIRV